MKSKIHKILILFSLIFVTFYCKKKEQKNEPQASQGSYYHPEKINSILSIYKLQYFDTDTLNTNSYSVQAFFSDTLTTENIGYSSADYGNVKLNSTFLKKQHPPNQVYPLFYYDTTAAIYEGVGSWIVDGNIPSHGFKTNVNINYASYNWWKNISDTLDLSRNLFLDFNELTGIYNVAVTVFTNSNSQTKPLVLNSHSITFTSSDLHGIFFGGGDVGRISIEIEKSDYRIINGLIINFKTVLVLQKNNFIIKQ